MNELAPVNFLRFKFPIRNLKFASLNKDVCLGISLSRLQPDKRPETSHGLVFQMGFSFSALLFETHK